MTLKLIPKMPLADLRKLNTALKAAKVRCYIISSDLGFVNYVAAGWIAVAWSDEDVEGVRYLFIKGEENEAALA